MRKWSIILAACALYGTLFTEAGQKRGNSGNPDLSKATKRVKTDVSRAGLNRQLLKAAKANDCAAITALIHAGADIATVDDENKTPLHHAAKKGHDEAVITLIQQGADIDACDSWKNTPLDYAVRTCALTTVDRFLNEADCLKIAVPSITQLFQLAVRNQKHPEVVRALLERGADVQQLNDQGDTCLHAAAISCPSSPDIINELIRHGVSVNAICDNSDTYEKGCTPLHYAARFGDHCAVVTLLQHGAALEAKTDSDGWTPLHQAIFNDENPKKVILALIEAKADIEARGKDGSTPLTLAAELCTEKIIPAIITLIRAGAKTETRNVKKDTPLHTALCTMKTNKDANMISTIRVLVQNGAHTEARNAKNLTPLQIVAAMDSVPVSDIFDTLEILKRAGASLMPTEDEASSITPLELFFKNLWRSKAPSDREKTRLLNTVIGWYLADPVADDGGTILHRLFSRKIGEVQVSKKQRYLINAVLTCDERTRALDVSKKNVKGETALHVMARQNPDLLSEYGRQLFEKERPDKQPALYKAITLDGETLESLVSTKIRRSALGKVKIVPSSSWTPLMHLVHTAIVADPCSYLAVTDELKNCKNPAYVTDTNDSALSVASCEAWRVLIRKAIKQKYYRFLYDYLDYECDQPHDMIHLIFDFTGLPFRPEISSAPR